MNRQSIQIAITAIDEWREAVKLREGGKHESPRFFEDIKIARKELKELLKELQEQDG